MGISEDPLAIANILTSLPEEYNFQAIQVDNTTQLQTLITVPFSEIVVLDQSQVKTLLPPDISLLVADIPEQGSHAFIDQSNMVIYVPQEAITTSTQIDTETQMARQWYEDSLVATQALSSLTQVLSQILSDTVDESAENNLDAQFDNKP